MTWCGACEADADKAETERDRLRRELSATRARLGEAEMLVTELVEYAQAVADEVGADDMFFEETEDVIKRARAFLAAGPKEGA
jgi:hypothetical protein